MQSIRDTETHPARKSIRFGLSRQIALLLVSAFAPARAQDSVAKLPAVVTITRDVGRSALDLPFAISETRPDSARPGQLHTMVDQTLFMLPGVTVSNRTNPSQ